MKYRLLKDLPGCDKGTIFTRHANNALVAAPGAGGKSHVTISAEAVTVSADWFELIPDEPERPYPWEPTPSHDFYIPENDRISHHAAGSFATSGFIGMAYEQGAVFRTKEDAELRLKAEPLVNAAVKAKLNRGSWCPVRGKDAYFIPEWKSGSWKPVQVLYYTGERMGDEYQYEKDCQAICDLYNFFLSTPHD